MTFCLRNCSFKQDEQTMNKQCTTPPDEYNKLHSLINFRFSHTYKKLALIGALLIFIFLLGYKFYGGNLLFVKDFCRSVILLLLLIASMSQDIIEDEYVNHVRAQSYIIAFIFALSYAIIIPLIALIFDFLITKLTGDGSINFYEISAFEVIFTLVCFQLLSFESMKRFERAQ